jgi:hypothetical protein
MTALTDLEGLLSSLPGYALLTTTMKQQALDQSVVPDGLGVWPGQPGYQPTYDIYWAALKLLGFLQAQPVVRQTSSEGTSVAVDAPNWAGLISYYQSMSTIHAVAGQALMTLVEIPDPPHVIHTDMSYGGGEPYDNVDTDLA